jgi:hypothetical protein
LVRRTHAVLVGLLLAVAVSSTARAAAPEKITATLDGRLIPASEIAEHDCHDLDFPIIRCFAEASDRDASLSVLAGVHVAAAAGLTYVTVWDGTNFTGASITLSQNYDTLVTIGWNDAISSFKGRNSETGRFYVDWFHGGASYSFCCNQQVGSLGTLNNTFTSVYRT